MLRVSLLLNENETCHKLAISTSKMCCTRNLYSFHFFYKLYDIPEIPDNIAIKRQFFVWFSTIWLIIRLCWTIEE